MKGLNKVSKKLADGTSVTYYYAWKGGPRLPGKPGDPAFLAAFNQAIAAIETHPTGTLQSVLNAYQQSTRFKDLSDKTRRDYVRMIRKIETDFGDFPIAALSDRRTRGEFLHWRDRLAQSSRRQADYALSVLALIIAWAFDRGLVPMNPVERPGKTYRSKRIDSIWTIDDEKRFLEKAPSHIGLAFMLALWTGQRQGDLLRLQWSAYDGETIRLRQGKTGVPVSIPVGEPLKQILDRTDRTISTILATSRNASWTESGFRSSWRTACAAAGIDGLTFHDLRGTAVTRLALAGATTPEIGTITGHGLKQVEAILDSHYLSRDSALGISAIRKREIYEEATKTPN